MADRNLAGEADQNVEAKGGDRKDPDLDQDAQGVLAEQQRRKTNQHDTDDRRVAAGPGRKDGGVGRVGGAEIAGRNQGGAGHVNYTRSMSLVPNRPYGLIIRMMTST